MPDDFETDQSDLAAEEAMRQYARGEIPPPPSEPATPERNYESILRDIRQQFDLREVNTIPRNVLLEVTFNEAWPAPDRYKFKTKRGEMEKGTTLCLATLKFNENATNLILGTPYPLSISQNALLGITNYINQNGKKFDLTSRKFTVITKNGVTYVWKEIT